LHGRNPDQLLWCWLQVVLAAGGLERRRTKRM
jgi:hypothetical protein